MGKLGNALYEIHHMDEMAAQNQWMNRLHPLVKLLLTIFYLTITVSFPKYSLAGLLCMGIYPIALFILGEIPFWDSLRRLRIVLPFVCLVGLFNPFFERQPILTIGSITITAGMVSMATLMIKGIYSILASYLLIATTSIEKICYAMRLLHIPSILVTQFLLTYRYISVLLTEANRMMQAYALRAPGQKGVHGRPASAAEHRPSGGSLRKHGAAGIPRRIYLCGKGTMPLERYPIFPGLDCSILRNTPGRSLLSCYYL